MKSIKTELFHGTDPDSAADLLACKIKSNVGGGEFGRGFYMGSSKRLAKRRAFHKTEGRKGSAQEAMKFNVRNTFVVEFNQQHLKLALHCKDLNRPESIKYYLEIKKLRQQFASPSIKGNDFIKGIIVGTKRYYDISQYNFHSDNSESFLNNHMPQIAIKRHLI